VSELTKLVAASIISVLVSSAASSMAVSRTVEIQLTSLANEVGELAKQQKKYDERIRAIEINQAVNKAVNKALDARELLAQN